ncbi:hypothetical protein B0H63DRAFT_45571 [Podospora didyma]|uniref:FAD synthase n=1 Tax=Podospora didyma TaxID=330526 RepID=A0AAE0U821_9PEZI|nr:hypothetical protein B0H63DRAFT_45571 [Podospora didyma]
MTQDFLSQHQEDSVPRTNGVVAKPAASAAAVTAAPHGAAPRTLPEVCYSLRHKVLAFLDAQIDDTGDEGDIRILRDTKDQTRISMGVIEEAIHKYGPEDLSLAYNGGKDCLALLVLIMACLPVVVPAIAAVAETPSANSSSTTATPIPSPSPPPPERLQAIYIAPPDPFPEVEEFVAVSTTEYHLDLVRYGLPMRPALEAYLADRPAVKAIFMGTRRTDPHSEFLKHFSPTDADWPQFMRVNPLIDWHYSEIWTFIRHLDIPFCCLYQQGFSSLGGMTNTRPNPALALDGPDGKRFRPAYELVRDDEERLGRDR